MIVVVPKEYYYYTRHELHYFFYHQDKGGIENELTGLIGEPPGMKIPPLGLP